MSTHLNYDAINSEDYYPYIHLGVLFMLLQTSDDWWVSFGNKCHVHLTQVGTVLLYLKLLKPWHAFRMDGWLTLLTSVFLQSLNCFGQKLTSLYCGLYPKLWKLEAKSYCHQLTDPLRPWRNPNKTNKLRKPNPKNAKRLPWTAWKKQRSRTTI